MTPLSPKIFNLLRAYYTIGQPKPFLFEGQRPNIIYSEKSLPSVLKQALHKGSTVYIEGKLKTRSYIDKEGTKHFITEIIADKLLMLDKKSSE